MSRADRDCVEQCLDGHPEVYRQLVARYQGVVLSYLAGQMGDRERAEEAAQETFVRAYFALGTLKKPESFYSWLLGIANRVTREQQRTEQRQRHIATMLPANAVSPETSNDLALERAIAELPEPYRQVVLLRYYGGLSCAEVGSQLDIPLGTVTKQLSRAYALLRESLCESDRQPARSEVRL